MSHSEKEIEIIECVAYHVTPSPHLHLKADSSLINESSSQITASLSTVTHNQSENSFQRSSCPSYTNMHLVRNSLQPVQSTDNNSSQAADEDDDI